ncbi:hypothetical protein NUW58_g4846 [Xylaria curta]|uniref:Uncharacterized protein n=1 Tax=Xylaria curta TaxID=42375 RepID=A0ACC1P5W1_9PEZI|nr:hypothetical protein NUW58_g4846 [Xylaria curta]
MACSYLIAECGWTPEEAIARFTERRMRPNFGPGVSIPSQLRWLTYVDRWTKGGKKYVDRELEIVEIHAWGLRNGVKLSVEGFVDQGKKIKVFHTFSKNERQIVEGNAPGGSGMIDMMYEMAGCSSGLATEQSDPGRSEDTDNKTNINNTIPSPTGSGTPTSTGSQKGSKRDPPKLISRVSRTGSTRSKESGDEAPSKPVGTSSLTSLPDDSNEPEPGGMAVIFKPQAPIRIHNSDVNISIERRHRAPKSVGLTMVTAVAHVWFNAFFEGNGPEQNGVPDSTGVFEIDWDKLDGIKGSSQKGTRAADRIAIVWKSIVPEDGREETVTAQPSVNALVPQMQAADWKGHNYEDPEKEKHLGLRVQSPDSAGVSKASSIIDEALNENKSNDTELEDDFKGLRSHALDNEGERQTSSEEASETESKQTDDKGSNQDSLSAYTERLPKLGSEST